MPTSNTVLHVSHIQTRPRADQVLFLKILLPAAGSATTTFLFALAGVFFRADFAALAALATPRRAAPAAGLFCSVVLAELDLVAARPAPRLGLTTVVLVDVVDMSVAEEWALD